MVCVGGGLLESGTGSGPLEPKSAALGDNLVLPGCMYIPGPWQGCQGKAGERAHQLWKNPGLPWWRSG